jgi:DNA-binding transcriptional MocR family regulator
VRVVIEEGMQDSYLAHLHATYRERIAVLDSALRTEMDEGVSYTVPQGGYFFWLRLRAGLDASVLHEYAARHKVGYRPGVRFSSRGELRNYLRLSFAFYEGAQLAEGARRLAAAVAELSEQDNRDGRH